MSKKTEVVKPDVRNVLTGLINNASETPMQRVAPIKGGQAEEDTFHINAKIPQSYERRIKQFCLDKNMTIKQFLITSIDNMLDGR